MSAWRLPGYEGNVGLYIDVISASDQAETAREAALFRATGFDVMAMTPRKALSVAQSSALCGVNGTAVSQAEPLSDQNRDRVARSMITGLIGKNPDGCDAAIISEFTLAVMRADWERDEDIGDEDIGDAKIVSAIAGAVGIEGDRLPAASSSDDARARLAAVTERAIEQGVFGVPMFLVGEEVFRAGDRLDFVAGRLRRAQPTGCRGEAGMRRSASIGVERSNDALKLSDSFSPK